MTFLVKRQGNNRIKLLYCLLVEIKKTSPYNLTFKSSKRNESEMKPNDAKSRGSCLVAEILNNLMAAS